MSPSVTRRRVAEVSATVIDATGPHRAGQQLAGEEPLEIRVAGLGGTVLWTTSTMRTPGQDFALAAGLLHAEGVIAEPGDVAEIRYCADAGEQQYNVVTVRLRGAPRRELGARTLAATASCGVCGTASIDEVCAWMETRGTHRAPGRGAEAGSGAFAVDATLLAGLPERLRREQPLFDATGGLHAAGLFDAAGRLLGAAEDIGRHNALDKVLGERFLARGLPADGAIAVVSSRVSFELVQKVAVAGVPVLCAVSAPSNLAVETARRLGITLAAFARGDRVTVYTHPERVSSSR